MSRYDPFNPLSPQHHADPYLAYERLVAQGPLHRTRSGTWLVAGHDLATEILKDPVFTKDYSASVSRAYGADFSFSLALRTVSNSFFFDGQKANGEIRRHFSRMLSATRLTSHLEALRELAGSSFSRYWAGAQDSPGEFAIHFTLYALSELFSIPFSLLLELRSLSAGLLTLIDCSRLSRARLAKLDVCIASTQGRFFAYLESAQAQQSECVAGLLQLAQTHRLALESIFADLLFVLVVGFESTAALIGEMAWFLTRHPETAHDLAHHPGCEIAAVEEFLRLFPSVHFVTRRAATDVEKQGSTFRKSDFVLVLIAAANRDPQVFPAPAEFSLTRPKSSRCLTFSPGPHHCIGATLARQEASVALQFLLHQRAVLESLSRKSPSWRSLGAFRSLYRHTTDDMGIVA